MLRDLVFFGTVTYMFEGALLMQVYECYVIRSTVNYGAYHVCF